MMGSWVRVPQAAPLREADDLGGRAYRTFIALRLEGAEPRKTISRMPEGQADVSPRPQAARTWRSRTSGLSARQRPAPGSRRSRPPPGGGAFVAGARHHGPQRLSPDAFAPDRRRIR